MADVILYKKPGCVGCNATVRHFNKKGIEYVEKDVTTNDEALSEVLALGYQQMPVVVIRDEEGNIVEHWSDYRKEKIDAL